MIKWALNLKLLSSSAYHALRTSGFIVLPSEGTLRDFTHYFKSESGFTSDLNRELIAQSGIEQLPEEKSMSAL